MSQELNLLTVRGGSTSIFFFTLSKMPYHTRLVAPAGEETYLSLQKWCETYWLQYAVYFENKKKDGTVSQDHYHMYLDGFKMDVDVKTIRQNLERKFSGVNRISFKLQKKTDVENLAYTMKQGNQILFVGIAQTLSVEAKMRNEAVQANMKKVKKTTSILEELKLEFPPREYMYDHQELVVGIIKYFHRKHKMQPDPFMLQKYVRTLCASHDIERYARTVWADYTSRSHGLEGFFSKED